MSITPFGSPFRKSLPPEIRDVAPHNDQAETVVLATILRDNSALATVRSIIKAEDFFTPNGAGLSWNGKIFMAMISLSDQQNPIDELTIIEWLKPDEMFQAHIVALNSAGNTWSGVHIEHYAKLVHEKAIQRQFLHKMINMQDQILSGQNLPSTQIAEDLELFTRETMGPKNGGRKLLAVDFRELLTMDLPPTEYVIDPVVPVRGTTMTFAWRGVGKTYVTMEQAFCVSSGLESVFGWPIPKQRKVVYVDGELDSSTLQERARDIARGHGMHLPDAGQLKLIGIDFQEDLRPKINSPEGRRQIEEHLEPGVWLILDNWDTLCPSGGDQDQEVCIEMQDWFLDLRKKQISSTFLHHAGKGGEQRGFSGKEDILASVVKLREPDDYKRREGLRAEVLITKLRGKPKPELLQPFELTLGSTSTGTLEWRMRPLPKLQLQRAFQMFQVGMKPADVAVELGLKNRYVAYRWRKKFEENPDPMGWDAE